MATRLELVAAVRKLDPTLRNVRAMRRAALVALHASLTAPVANAYRTRTNSHYLVKGGTALACKPNSPLPKGTAYTIAPGKTPVCLSCTGNDPWGGDQARR